MEKHRSLVVRVALVLGLFGQVLYLHLPHMAIAAVASSSPISPIQSPLSPLTSPISPPVPLEETEPTTPQVTLTFTPAFTAYLPLVARPFPIVPNKFGTEADDAYSDAVGARAIEAAGFSWFRHVSVDWPDLEPTYGVYTMTPGGPTGRYQAFDDGIARASAAGLRPILLIRNAPA